MPRAELHLNSTDETARFGSLLARLLRGGDIVLLTGELGAGKTTLVRAVAQALGVEPRRVSSPTFTVMHEYTPPTGPVIVHADAYRLDGDDEAELDLLGWDSATAGDTIVLIEWGERIADLLDREHASITMKHTGESERAVVVVVPDAWADRPEWAITARMASESSGEKSNPPGFPFASEREQYADLYRWFSGSYRISRPIEESDLDAE